MKCTVGRLGDGCGLGGAVAVQRDIKKPPGVGQSQIQVYEDTKYNVGWGVNCSIQLPGGREWRRPSRALPQGTRCEDGRQWAKPTGYVGRRIFPVRVVWSPGGCSVPFSEPYQPGAQLCFQQQVDPKDPSQPKLFDLLRH